MKDIPEKPAYYSRDVGVEDGKLETHRLAAVSFEFPPCRPLSNSGKVAIQARGSPDFGEISDLNQNMWIFQDENLLSVPRRKGVTPVTVAVLSCKYNVPSEKNNLFPIYLGLKDFEKCLSCEEIEGNHKLQLKDKKILDLYNEPGPVTEFLFYRNQDGRTCTFESVAFPGWFIASSDKGQPLFLTSSPGQTHNTAFMYEHSS